MVGEGVSGGPRARVCEPWILRGGLGGFVVDGRRGREGKGVERGACLRMWYGAGDVKRARSGIVKKCLSSRYL